jgi:hypothetical protein
MRSKFRRQLSKVKDTTSNIIEKTRRFRRRHKRQQQQKHYRQAILSLTIVYLITITAITMLFGRKFCKVTAFRVTFVPQRRHPSNWNYPHHDLVFCLKHHHRHYGATTPTLWMTLTSSTTSTKSATASIVTSSSRSYTATS